MHRFAEQRSVVAAIVQANHFQMLDIGAFQQIQRGRCLAEAPQFRQGDAQYPAQQHAIYCIVGDDQQGVVATQAVAGTLQRWPCAIQHLLQGFAADAWHLHHIRRIAPGLQALAVTLADFAGKQTFPVAVGDFHQAVVERQLRRTRVAQRKLCSVACTRQR